MFERKKIGLALSGGGMRGLAHIGVLRVLEDYKIPIDFISGTSIGALIGAFYASEPNAKKLEKEVLKEDLKKLFDYTLSRYGLIKGKKIEEYLQNNLKNITFKDLKIPLFITAYDIENKREIIFHKGDVTKAVRASISIPGIFIPVENKNRILVDAGIVDPIPSEVLKKMGADIVIAVNVDDVKEKPALYNETAIEKKEYKRKLPSMYESSMKSFNIIGSEAAKADIARDHIDFVININLEDISLFDYKEAKKAIEKGKCTARKCLSNLKNISEQSPFKNFLDELNKNLNIGVEQITNPIKEVKKTIKI